MAVYREPQQTEENELQRVPSRLQRGSFLEDLRTDFSQFSTSSGTLTKGEFQLNFNPVTLSVAMGNLTSNYSDESLFFVSPRLRLDKTTRSGTNIFGDTAIAVVPYVSPLPETTNPGTANIFGPPDKSASVFKSFTFGATYDLISRGRFSLRTGFDMSGLWESAGMTGINQLDATFGVGSSVSYNPATFYAIGRFFMGPNIPQQEYWTRVRPHYMETKAGLVFSLDRTDVGAEVTHSPFETGGRLFASLRALAFQPQAYFSFNDTSPIFGSVREFIAGVRLSLDRRKKNDGRVTEQRVGVGEQSASRVTYHNLQTSVFAFRAVYLGQNSKLTEEQTTDARAQEEFAGITPKFLERLSLNISESTTFDQFVQRYQGATVEERINVATYLAGLAVLYYDNNILAASVFSDLKKVEETLLPPVVYGNVRQSLETGKGLSAGICTNINSMAVDFLRRTGIEAYAIGIAGRDTMHLIGVAKDPSTNTNYLINYGSQFSAEGQSILPVVQEYARENRLLLQGIYVYGENNEIVGLYRGPDGRLTEAMVRGEDDLLRRSLIRRTNDEGV